MFYSYKYPTDPKWNRTQPRPPWNQSPVCTKFQASVACDSCNKWFHKDCILMNSQNFSALKNISWHCFNCGLPNFSSALFSESVNVSNSFSSLDSSFDFSIDSNKFTTSTPNDKSKLKTKIMSGLTTVIVNFQSYFEKRVEFSNFCDDN